MEVEPIPKPGYKSITISQPDYDYWKEEWEKVKEQYRREKGITSFSGYICYLLSHATAPQFEHFNTNQDHATIHDRKLGLYVDVYPRPEGKLYCSYCESTKCEHIRYALTVPEITGPLRKKGWPGGE